MNKTSRLKKYQKPNFDRISVSDGRWSTADGCKRTLDGFSRDEAMILMNV